MSKLPIRSVIERALEKGRSLEDLVALPMVFESGTRRVQPPEGYVQIAEPHGIYYPVANLKISRVWYTERSIEVDLSNRMHISIETKPLTFAIHLTTAKEGEDIESVQVQLIRHDEEDSVAALVEARIRNLRQVYAIACIAYGSPSYVGVLSKAGPSRFADFEDYLPEEDRLLVKAAGQGSMWVTVGVKAVAAVKAAPRAALVAISTIFKGGPERIVRAAEAFVKIQEGTAEEAVAKATLAEAQAEKGKAEAKLASASANEAAEREAMLTDKQRFDLQKQKVDAYFDIRSKIDAIEDPEARTTLLMALNTNAQELLGSVAQDWLAPPPSSR
jgi:hypothetical protein